MNYDLFLNILAIYFIIKGLISFTFPYWYNRTVFKDKGRNFFINKLFGTTTENTWRLFYLGILWLTIYHLETIKNFIGI